MDSNKHSKNRHAHICVRKNIERNIVKYFFSILLVLVSKTEINELQFLPFSSNIIQLLVKNQTERFLQF